MVTPTFLSVLRSLYSEAEVIHFSGFCLANVSNREFWACFADIFCLPTQTTNSKVHLIFPTFCFSSANTIMGLLMNLFQWIYSCKKLIICRWICRVGSRLYSARQLLKSLNDETIRLPSTSWQLCVWSGKATQLQKEKHCLWNQGNRRDSRHSSFILRPGYDSLDSA